MISKKYYPISWGGLISIIGVIFLIGLGIWVYSVTREKELNYDTLGNIENWDYSIYGYGGKDNDCPQVKLYGDSYCDINCLDNISFRTRLSLENKQTAIPALQMYIERNQSYNCSYDCFGKFKGYTCDTRGVDWEIP